MHFCIFHVYHPVLSPTLSITHSEPLQAATFGNQLFGRIVPIHFILQAFRWLKWLKSVMHTAR